MSNSNNTFSSKNSSTKKLLAQKNHSDNSSLNNKTKLFKKSTSGEDHQLENIDPDSLPSVYMIKFNEKNNKQQGPMVQKRKTNDVQQQHQHKPALILEPTNSLNSSASNSMNMSISREINLEQLNHKLLVNQESEENQTAQQNSSTAMLKSRTSSITMASSQFSSSNSSRITSPNKKNNTNKTKYF
jgi:hypothetical protein